jgi:hypothetical protein
VRSAVPLVALCSLLAACSRPRSDATASPAASTPKSTLALGEPVTAQLIPLTDIAREPGRYRDKLVATSGRVTSVCQEMGCWLELQDAAGRAHVRIHGHSFFVPKTSPGHVARVQAKVVAGGHGEEDCEERAGSADGGLAKVELDATGVEID